MRDNEVQRLEQTRRVQRLDGRDRYVHACGACEFESGPTVGFVLRHLDRGGLLPENASNDNTGVFNDGRQLHLHDVIDLQPLVGMVLPRCLAVVP